MPDFAEPEMAYLAQAVISEEDALKEKTKSVDKNVEIFAWLRIYD